MKRSRIILLAVAALLVLGVAGLWQWRSHEHDGSAAFARGIAALNKGQYRVARVELMNAVKRDPRSVDARMAQARTLVELGDGPGAQAEILRARALGSPAARSRAVMAQALLLQGDVDGALKEAEARDLPQDQYLLSAHVRAQVAMRQNNLAMAGAILSKVLEQVPDDADGWIDLARLRRMQGDEAGAIGAASRAVALAPGDVAALTLRAELVRSQYGPAASLPWFDRALAVDPDSVPTLEQYAATLADMGKASRMLSLSRRILALSPDNARAWMMQAVMAARAGRPDLARTLLARTQGRLDGEPATILLRGVLHMAEGNALLATETLAPLVEMQPDNGTARALLGRAYVLNGDYASAATIMAPMVAQRDASPYVLTLAARAQEALGNRTMADDMLTRAAWPDRPATDIFASANDGIRAMRPPASVATAQDNIPYIRALLRGGMVDAAVMRARQLSKANVGAPAAWMVLGDTLDVAGRPGEAAQAYAAAANIRFDRDSALRLAAAWSRAGDNARAAQVIGLFLSQNPDDVAATRLLATIAAQTGDWRSARRWLEAVRARIGNGDALLMAELARAALEMGDAKQARSYAAAAYALMPSNPMVADMYGWTLTRTGRTGAASIDLLEKALALAPGRPDVQLHLGQAYAAAGRKDEARLTLARAAATPGFGERQQALDALAAL